MVSFDIEQLVLVEEVDATLIGGGSTHNFDRDENPLSPDDRYDWEWEDKKGFGFR